jgi:hypothetical protein
LTSPAAASFPAISEYLPENPEREKTLKAEAMEPNGLAGQDEIIGFRSPLLGPEVGLEGL